MNCLNFYVNFSVFGVVLFLTKCEAFTYLLDTVADGNSSIFRNFCTNGYTEEQDERICNRDSIPEANWRNTSGFWSSCSHTCSFSYYQLTYARIKSLTIEAYHNGNNTISVSIGGSGNTKQFEESDSWNIFTIDSSVFSDFETASFIEITARSLTNFIVYDKFTFEFEDINPTTAITTEESTTEEITTPEESTTEESTTEEITTEESTTEEITTEEITTEESTTEEITTEEITTEEITTEESTTTGESKTTRESTSTEENKTPEATTTEENKTPEATTTEENKTPEATTTEENKTPEATTTEENKTPEATTTQVARTSTRLTSSKPSSSVTSSRPQSTTITTKLSTATTFYPSTDFPVTENSEDDKGFWTFSNPAFIAVFVVFILLGITACILFFLFLEKRLHRQKNKKSESVLHQNNQYAQSQTLQAINGPPPPVDNYNYTIIPLANLGLSRPTNKTEIYSLANPSSSSVYGYGTGDYLPRLTRRKDD